MPVIGNRGIKPYPQEPEVPVTRKQFLEVWFLREMGGLSPSEISDRTGLHVAIVQQMLRENN